MASATGIASGGGLALSDWFSGFARCIRRRFSATIFEVRCVPARAV